MESKGKYGISISGEFVDKTLEKEFLNYDMKFYSGFIGLVAVLFGITFMLFSISDYFSIKNFSSLMIIVLIRALFLTASIVMYFTVKRINQYSNLIYMIIAYEIDFFISFIVIIHEYGPIGIISFLSVMAITLAVYITPNRLIYSQSISILFILLFFLFYTNFIEKIETGLLLKLIGYSLIFVLFGNIQAYLASFYRRKQFADSKELLRLSITDPLTGIYNRAKFDRELDLCKDSSNRFGYPLSLVIFDIDDFKKVNDQYGHLTGDSVMKSTADIVKKAIRGTDILARWGGDEFVILLPNTDIQKALGITKRVKNFIKENKYDEVGNVTCSFGLVLLRKNESAEILLQRADKYLYIAKERGKNTISSEADDLFK